MSSDSRGAKSIAAETATSGGIGAMTLFYWMIDLWESLVPFIQIGMEG